MYDVMPTVWSWFCRAIVQLRWPLLLCLPRIRRRELPVAGFEFADELLHVLLGRALQKAMAMIAVLMTTQQRWFKNGLVAGLLKSAR